MICTGLFCSPDDSRDSMRWVCLNMKVMVVMYTVYPKITVFSLGKKYDQPFNVKYTYFQTNPYPNLSDHWQQGQMLWMDLVDNWILPLEVCQLLTRAPRGCCKKSRKPTNQRSRSAASCCSEQETQQWWKSNICVKIQHVSASADCFMFASFLQSLWSRSCDFLKVQREISGKSGPV